VTAEKSMVGKQVFSFRAQELELKSALAMFARANNLNIVPDSDVTGTVTVDLREVPLAEAMESLLLSSDCVWKQQNNLIRVRAAETRTFKVDYLRMIRTGSGSSSANLASASSGGGASGGGGAGGGGGGGAGGGGPAGSSVNVQQDNPVEFWKELREELGHLLTEKGKGTLAINMTAGLIQVTDRPAALERMASYLEGLKNTIHRQVDIEARLYDVTLSDQFQLGVDWEHAIQMYGGQMAISGSPTPTAAAGGFNLKNGTFAVDFKNANTKVLLQALQEQGEVKVISKPSIRTLNNQTALIKVGTERPFFSQATVLVPTVGTTTGGTATTAAGVEQDIVTTITIGTILAITPQISDDDYVSLDISPVLTSLVETQTSPNKRANAPVLDIKQASTLIRVRSGSTVVMGGLIQEETAKTQRKLPIAGDIPILGHLFRGKFEGSRRRELIIFITPRLVEEDAVAAAK
jgi:MSHA type pilus biogenesis protein MshL